MPCSELTQDKAQRPGSQEVRSVDAKNGFGRGVRARRKPSGGGLETNLKPLDVAAKFLKWLPSGGRMTICYDHLLSCNGHNKGSKQPLSSANRGDEPPKAKPKNGGCLMIFAPNS